MSRFSSCIILLSVFASCQSAIVFNYASQVSFSDPETFNVGVDFVETTFSNFSTMEMKPRTDWAPTSEAGEFHIVLGITYFGGALERNDKGACTITADQSLGSTKEYSSVGESPDKAVANMNEAITEVAGGVNYKSSWGVGPNSIQLNVRRATSELAQAIDGANCDTLSLTYGRLI